MLFWLALSSGAGACFHPIVVKTYTQKNHNNQNIKNSFLIVILFIKGLFKDTWLYVTQYLPPLLKNELTVATFINQGIKVIFI